jgi:N-acetylglucosamine-6-phosphate deacetylase
LKGNVLTPRGFVRRHDHVADDGRVAGIEGISSMNARCASHGLPLILPGFIDLHVHGGGGRDMMEGGDAAERVAALHARTAPPRCWPPR